MFFWSVGMSLTHGILGFRILNLLANQRTAVSTQLARLVDSGDNQQASVSSASSSASSTPLLHEIESQTSPKKPIIGYDRLMGKHETRRALRATAGVLAILLLGFFSSVLLPNSWLNWTAHKIRVNAIEIVDHVSAFKDFKFGYVMRPEVPGAIFKTLTINMGDKVIAKLYPDVYLFYGYLLIVTPALRFSPRSSLQLFTFIIITSAFMASFVHSWWYHNWHGWWGGVEGFIVKEPSWWEKMARTLGQVSSVVLGLLAIPTGKTSPFNSLANVSWERAMGLHRLLGNVFLLVTLLHVFSWWNVFHEQGVFPHDAIAGVFKSAPTFFPLNGRAAPGRCKGPTCLDPEYGNPISDNFTIPLMNFLGFYVLLPVFGLLTLNSVRRSRYEWFLYPHQLFAGVIVAATLWHAAASLVFLLPGICIIVFDRIARFTQTIDRGHSTQVTSIRTIADQVVALELAPTKAFKEGFIPGQYIMVNFPLISELEFHPFSVSSASSLTVHAKVCGDFTRAMATGLAAGSEAIVLGPYGLPPPKLADRDSLVFIAGGIGITPIISILEALASGGQRSNQSVAITLLWICRGRALFEEFAPVVEEVRGLVTIKLYDSCGSAPMDAEVPSPSVQIIQGRPVNLLAEIGPDVIGNTLIFACGPPALVADARTASAEIGAAFHEEVFEL